MPRLLHSALAWAVLVVVASSHQALPCGHVRSEQSDPVKPSQHVHWYVGEPLHVPWPVQGEVPGQAEIPAVRPQSPLSPATLVPVPSDERKPVSHVQMPEVRTHKPRLEHSCSVLVPATEGDPDVYANAPLIVEPRMLSVGRSPCSCVNVMANVALSESQI